MPRGRKPAECNTVGEEGRPRPTGCLGLQEHRGEHSRHRRQGWGTAEQRAGWGRLAAGMRKGRSKDWGPGGVSEQGSEGRGRPSRAPRAGGGV